MTTDAAPFTITAAADRIRRGDLAPVELLDVCLARIDRYEDRVKAWAYIDRDGARLQAERLTSELKRGQIRGPLHGIPVGIKDIIDVFDMPTGCGSKRWANSYARRDAACVERLRSAGAVVLGKTVTTAYASFDPPPTRNPWNLAHTPGGSSSGSAAAVACGMCLGALATQTGGSITRPASYCGVYSLKPSHGRVSVDGVLPLAPSLDHIGVMANSVRDLAILLQPMLPKSSRPIDPDAERVRRRRPLVVPANFPATAEAPMSAAFDTLRHECLKAKWDWESLALPASFADATPFQHTVMAVEAAAYHAERMQRHPDDYPPKVTGLIEKGLHTPAPEFVRILEHLKSFRSEFERLFGFTQRTFITPAATGAAPTAETTGDPAFNAPWSYTGLPTVSLPFAWTESGLPLAVQLIGRQWCEDDLLAVAAMLEETIAFPGREVPL